MITDETLKELAATRIEQLHIKAATHSRLGLTNYCSARRCRDRWPCWHHNSAKTELGRHGIALRTGR
jgi:hypothetical protein